MPLLLRAVLLSAVLGLVSCNDTTKVGIDDVRYIHVKDDNQVDATDRMVSFRKDSILHGTVGLEEKKSRYGSYYTVFWWPMDREKPATVKFEYRQQKSGPKTLEKEIKVAEPEKYNATEFAVIGEEFAERGVVFAWRASVWQGGKEIGHFDSFLW